MELIVGDSYLKNGFAENVNSYNAITASDRIVIYEVIRIINSKLLFFDDHWKRLEHSVRISACALRTTKSKIVMEIAELCEINQLQNGNVRLSFEFPVSNRVEDLRKVFLSPHNYPTDDLYTNGVATGLLYAERMNPNAKVVNRDLKTQATALMDSKSLHEVLLVNRDGFLTEGSVSNLFFLHQGRIVTAPEEMVLSGITRKYVIEACDRLSLPITYKAVHTSELSTYEAAFICGTSPKVLPLKQIETSTYNPNLHTLRLIMSEFDQIMDENLIDLL